MQTVSVVALKDFEIDGHPVHAGQKVDLEPVQAAVRAHAGEVSLDPRYPETYRTKEMRAADPAPPVEVKASVTRRRRSRRPNSA